jgi:hypothetical protein
MTGNPSMFVGIGLSSIIIEIVFELAIMFREV